MFRKRISLITPPPLRQNAVKRILPLAAGGMVLVLAIFGLAFTSCKGNHPSPKAKLTSISVAKEPDKITYEIGEEATYEGILVTALYSNGKTKDVPFEELVFSGFDSSEPGIKEITVEWQGKGVPGTTTFGVTVKEPTPITVDGLIKITLTKPDKTVYEEGIDTEVDKSGLKLTASYTVSGDRVLSEGVDYNLGTPLDLSAADFEQGSKTIAITYTFAGADEVTEKPGSFAVTAKKLNSISLSKTTISFARGTPIATIIEELNKVVVTAHYGEDSTRVVATAHNGSADNINVSTKGSYEVTYTFAGKTAKLSVVINAPLTPGNPNDPDSAAIRLDPKTLELVAGGPTAKLNIITNPADTTDVVTATWVSSNEVVATVNAEGVVTPRGAGSATITATIKINGAEPAEGLPKTLTCAVTVKAQKPVGITWNQIMDPGVAITGPALSVTANGKPHETVVEVTGVSPTAYKWYVGNVEVGTGSTYTVEATQDKIGTLSLTVEVFVNGRWYNKTVTFTVGL